MKIRKAVIPAAGLGTRFLPATKAVPKELLPIVDAPTIQYIAEEAVSAGIEEIILITSMGKEAIADHFDLAPELIAKLQSSGQEELAERVRHCSELVRIICVRQGVPRGLGHAISCAEHVVGDEDFAVLLGDDLVLTRPPLQPCLKQMVDIYNEQRCSVLALMEVTEAEVSRFGICAGQSSGERLIDIDTMVEKPALKDAPSRTAIVGRYILKSSIFPILRETKPGSGGEIQLTDALKTLANQERVLGYSFQGERYDAGDKIGFLQANIAYALEREEYRAPLIEYLKEVVSTN